MRTETVKAMAESADKIIILTDSSKFSERGVVSQFKINEISYLFTDDNIPEEIFENLKKEKVEVQMVSVN
jgi:DeoR/GlpR family transcriptional regulator of sugar metabolism